MKKKYSSILTLAAMLCAASLQAATNITVMMKDGTKSEFQLSEEGKMFFSDNNLCVQAAPTSKLTVYSIADIRKVTFDKSETGLTNNGAESDVFAFPNPVKDRMFLSNVKEGSKLSIYNMQGALVAEMNYSEEGVDLSSLAAGSYVISVNGVSLKVNKL